MSNITEAARVGDMFLLVYNIHENGVVFFAVGDPNDESNYETFARTWRKTMHPEYQTDDPKAQQRQAIAKRFVEEINKTEFGQQEIGGDSMWINRMGVLHAGLAQAIEALEAA